MINRKRGKEREKVCKRGLKEGKKYYSVSAMNSSVYFFMHSAKHIYIHIDIYTGTQTHIVHKDASSVMPFTPFYKKKGTLRAKVGLNPSQPHPELASLTASPLPISLLLFSFALRFSSYCFTCVSRQRKTALKMGEGDDRERKKKKEREKRESSQGILG